MTTALETYLGWQDLKHLAGCTRPAWSVDVRTDHDELRDRNGGGQAHACPNEDCAHSDRYERTTVRIVCRSCQAAVVIRGEDVSTSRGMTVNTTWGYGQKPRTMAGLLLWPGEPWLNFGRLSSDEPFDYVVTRTGVTQVTDTDVVGVITQNRSKRGAVIWQAAASPAPGRYVRLNWGRTSEGTTLRTVAAAAKWIAAQLEAEGGGS